MVLWKTSFVVCVHKHILLDLGIVCFGGAMRSVYFCVLCFVRKRKQNDLATSKLFIVAFIPFKMFFFFLKTFNGKCNRVASLSRHLLFSSLNIEYKVWVTRTLKDATRKTYGSNTSQKNK